MAPRRVGLHTSPQAKEEATQRGQEDRNHAPHGNVDEYDDKVLRLTSEISEQVFPIALDMDHPHWDRGLRSMQKAFTDMDKAKKRGGVIGAIGKAMAGTRAALTFVSLYTIPSKKIDCPEDPRLEPVW